MKYMPQDVFDGCALVVAMAHFAGADAQEIVGDLERQYSQSYADENMGSDIKEAADRIVVELPKLMQGDYTHQQLAGACKTLSTAIQKFNVDGAKRKRGFLGGTLFNYEKQEIREKPSRCMATIASYHVALASGAIDPRSLT